MVATVSTLRCNLPSQLSDRVNPARAEIYHESLPSTQTAGDKRDTH
jgi:hypothetical protein